MNSDFNLNKLVRENVAQLKPYSSARNEFKKVDRKMIFLDANENPNETGLNRYPDPQQTELKNKIGAVKGIKTNQILLGNGSDEILDLLFRAFCEPKIDNVLCLPPTYGMYGVLANLNNVENREVFLSPSFEPDIDSIYKKLDKHTKIIFLCSPNNPTGNTFSEDCILEILENFKGLVVIDEAYIDFSDKLSWLTQLAKFPNLIIVQTLSKAYGMAGIRLGICFASEEIIQILNKIKPPYNVNELTQKKALECLADLKKVTSEISEIVTERKRLKKKLEQLNFVKKVYRSDANFLLMEVDDAEKRYRQLLKNGIVARNRSQEPLCENTLRITVGTPTENKKLMDIISKL